MITIRPLANRLIHLSTSILVPAEGKSNSASTHNINELSTLAIGAEITDANELEEAYILVTFSCIKENLRIN